MGKEEAFDALEDNPHLKGRASEAIIKAEFLCSGLNVLSPEYNVAPYDLVVEAGGEFHRVQCKTGRDYRDGDGIIFLCQTQYRNNTEVVSSGYDGKADVFAVYHPGSDEIFMVPIEDATESGEMTIRLKKPRNNQTKGVNWYEDYLLTDWIESIKK